jgi:predicted restriction endonuclease
VARKLGNFGSFDPRLAANGITGLPNASKLDRQIWEAFHDDWQSLVIEADTLRTQFASTSIGMTEERAVSQIPKLQTTERFSERKVRIGQQFFRDAVLSSFNGQCCISGLNVPGCLVASHIIPWKECETARVDPANGLCLAATFDCLFDRFLITVETDLRLKFTSHLRESSNSAVRWLVEQYDNRTISAPERFTPKEVYLQYHNERFESLDHGETK